MGGQSSHISVWIETQTAGAGPRQESYILGKPQGQRHVRCL
jgi:hypothetical protein